MLGLLRNQQGDTIVEVLIAIAIISLVLVTAYVVSNRNVQAIQTNQERLQAQHLVESQIEALRAQGSLSHSGDCFIGTAETLPTAPGHPCSTISEPGSGATYSVSVQGPVAGVYTIRAVWTSLGAQTANDSNVTMVYELN